MVVLIVRIDQTNQVAEYDAMLVAQSRPGQDDCGKCRVGDMNGNGQVETTARVSAPIVEDVLAVSINGGFWQHNGYYRNSITDERVRVLRGSSEVQTGH